MENGQLLLPPITFRTTDLEMYGRLDTKMNLKKKKLNKSGSNISLKTDITGVIQIHKPSEILVDFINRRSTNKTDLASFSHRFSMNGVVNDLMKNPS